MGADTITSSYIMINFATKYVVAASLVGGAIGFYIGSKLTNWYINMDEEDCLAIPVNLNPQRLNHYYYSSKADLDLKHDKVKHEDYSSRTSVDFNPERVNYNEDCSTTDVDVNHEKVKHEDDSSGTSVDVEHDKVRQVEDCSTTDVDVTHKENCSGTSVNVSNDPLKIAQVNNVRADNPVVEEDLNITFIENITEGVFGPIDRVKFGGKDCLRKKLVYPSDRKNFFNEHDIMQIIDGAGRSSKVVATGWNQFLVTVDGDKMVSDIFTKAKHEQLLGIMLLTARGLEKIHRKGISHNDIRQNNILANTTTGRLNLIDFGLSTFMGEPLSIRHHWDFSNCNWIAPELRRGEKSDPKSDVYSLGVMLDFVLRTRFPEVEKRLLKRTMTPLDECLIQLRKSSLAEKIDDRLTLDDFIIMLSDAISIIVQNPSMYSSKRMEGEKRINRKKNKLAIAGNFLQTFAIYGHKCWKRVVRNIPAHNKSCLTVCLDW